MPAHIDKPTGPAHSILAVAAVELNAQLKIFAFFRREGRQLPPRKGQLIVGDAVAPLARGFRIQKFSFWLTVGGKTPVNIAAVFRQSHCKVVIAERILIFRLRVDS